MQEIILVNPQHRPSKRRKTRRTAAQKRATAKLVALNRRREHKGAKTMSNPKRRTRRNPAKRASAKRTYAIRANPRRRTHRRRRNPIGMNAAKPMELITPALVGALGATAVNTVLANIGSALPTSLTTGNMAYVTRAALSIGLGMIGAKSSKRNIWMQAAEGSLTVTFHDALVSLSSGMGMPLSGMGMYMPGRVANQVVPGAGSRSAPQLNGMSAYLTGRGSPAAQAMIRARQIAVANAPRRMSGFGF